jgi:serine protease AprX
MLADRVETASTGATYFRLSGTSMSTAVASGVVALLLQAQPGLEPDQVKAILTGTSRPFGYSSGATPPRAAIGAGLGDAHAAVTSGPRGSANRGLRPADGFARAIYSAIYGQPLIWENPLLGGLLWNLLGWANLAWDNLAWDNLAWDNIAYDNLAWDNLAWDNLAYDNLAWDNLAWDNLAWDSARDRD